METLRESVGNSGFPLFFINVSPGNDIEKYFSPFIITSFRSKLPMVTSRMQESLPDVATFTQFESFSIVIVSAKATELTAMQTVSKIIQRNTCFVTENILKFLLLTIEFFMIYFPFSFIKRLDDIFTLLTHEKNHNLTTNHLLSYEVVFLYCRTYILMDFKSYIQTSYFTFEFSLRVRTDASSIQF